MERSVHFDHLEVHVQDIQGYVDFLVRLFRGGRWKMISDSGTSMFITPDGINIEVKQAEALDSRESGRGFCLPCVRMKGALNHLASLDLLVDRTLTNPEGDVHFFRDPEGIQWHVKDYDHRDRYINW